ncbi:3-oxoacyl-[acyl-carrier-protein] synthase 2 [Candidatus Promineifilum breve]|uniref:3-oxoacyl-[acyl-carrier-protein] synthase 2 n=1 Tax=Candidatus Promineifilum breve TaxID=1806508 RepID=A0A160T388_9CHLR|nr:beta-ketoacyl-ACP synthase II [Candidatus Promineifilum breve]CUS04456.2 3-oxoacyl-[acyl-carrier-protein] synthase 2 [Candidatus Promineifilum breve]
MNNGNEPRRRVVITGVGLITPLGHNVPDTWAAVLRGQSGFGPITLVDNPNHTIGGLCEVKDFDPADYMDRKDARRRDRYQQLAATAAHEAMRQAGLTITDDNREQIGITLGTGIGGMRTIIEQEAILHEGGLRRLNPFGITMIMPNGAAGMLAIDYGILGPTTTITTACAAGNDAVGHAFRAIRYGELDAILTGGAESILTSVAIGGFERAGATSTRIRDTPQPFDADRDGLVIGEGAGMLVLESLEHAQARGATILAEIVGYGQTTDAHHITAPPDDGSGAARAIRKALADARLRPEDIDYVSAHGTATPLNDAAETTAIKAALGEHAYRTAVSSTKSMTGHIMGATGAIESVFCTLAIRDQIMPPTINYYTPDPACDLDYVPNTARPGRVRVCLNNAFGFGGHNAVVVVREYEE